MATNQPGAHGAGEGWTPAQPYLWSYDHDGLVDYWQYDAGVGGDLVTSWPWHFVAIVRDDGNVANQSNIAGFIDAAQNNQIGLIDYGQRVGMWHRAGGGGLLVRPVSLAGTTPAATWVMLAGVSSDGGANGEVWKNTAKVTQLSAALAMPAAMRYLRVAGVLTGIVRWNGPISRLLTGPGPLVQADIDLLWGLHDWRRRGAHVWLFGDDPLDTATTLHDSGTVGGWDLTAVGAPTKTYGMVTMP